MLPETSPQAADVWNEPSDSCIKCQQLSELEVSVTTRVAQQEIQFVYLLPAQGKGAGQKSIDGFSLLVLRI